MLNSIRRVEIESFKAFGKRACFDLKPVTLLYGQNSSGKSSFLHSLLYLKDVLETGECSARHTLLGGKAVDLGGFAQLVYRHDLRRRVVFRFFFDFSADPVFDRLRETKEVWVEFQVGVGSNSIPALLAVEISFDQVQVRFERGGRGSPFVFRTASDTKDLVPLPGSFFAPEATDAPVTGPAVSPILYELITSFEIRLREFLKSLSYVGPLRAYPSRFFAREEGSSNNSSDVAGTGRDAWDRLSADADLRKRINEWLERFGVASKCQFDIHDWLRTANVDRLKGGELDRALAQIQAMAEDHLDGYSGAARDVLGPIFANLGGWIRTNSDLSLSELFIVAGADKIRLSHRDVGTGFSQVLPVLVRSIGDLQRTVLIEQPELHVHPALQLDLADVFLEGAFQCENRFVIETHSEHILLRMLKRIRQAYDAPRAEGSEVRPSQEDVSFIFLDSDADGAKTTPSVPKRDGAGFIDGWPEGFFGERTGEFL